jgi:hypothetical protein
VDSLPPEGPAPVRVRRDPWRRSRKAVTAVDALSEHLDGGSTARANNCGSRPSMAGRRIAPAPRSIPVRSPRGTLECVRVAWHNRCESSLGEHVCLLSSVRQVARVTAVRWLGRALVAAFPMPPSHHHGDVDGDDGFPCPLRPLYSARDRNCDRRDSWRIKRRANVVAQRKDRVRSGARRVAPRRAAVRKAERKNVRERYS